MRIPMSSPKKTNVSNAWILPMKIDRRTAMALDQGNRRDEFAATRADLSDPAKRREVGEDDDPRSRLMNWIDQKIEAGNDQEVSGLLEQLEGHGASGEQRGGEGMSLDDQVANLARFLKGKGMGDRDVRTACDLARDALGIGESTKFGGVFGGNMGGNLRSQVSQPDTNPTDPAARDRNFMTYEEAAGACPYSGDRGSRPIGGRDSFEELFAKQDKVQQAREMMRPRRRRSEREIAMDSGTESFLEMFPEARRIRNYI
jgi:hypothetical protein